MAIEKAREWYSYGGELKKLALSVFTEKEIKENVLPNSWEEFFEMYLLEKDKKEWQKVFANCHYYLIFLSSISVFQR